MFTLVIGGSASGKSAWAERHVTRLPGTHVYLATMQPDSGEGLDRIRRHRELRAGKQFLTVERYTDLAGAPVAPGSNVLLEDLGNLLANELYSPAGGGTEAVRRGITALRQRCAHLTIVSNEVFSGGAAYEAETLRYLRELAQLNRELAAAADCVVELVCGLSNFLKGDAI